MIFMHDKGHMFQPRADKIFGSDYILMEMQEQIAERTGNGTDTLYYQYHEFGRTHWKSLDTPEKRCDSENKYNATKCITHFLESSMGCSMSMAESDREMKR